MRRAKTKFRPSKGGTPASPKVKSPEVLRICQKEQTKSPVANPLVPVSVEPANQVVVLTPVPDSQVSKKATIPVNASFTPLTTSNVNGDEIVPPDNPEAEIQSSLENDLFRFKVPPKVTPGPANTKSKAGKSVASASTGKSSRAIAMARRKQAEKNIAKNTSDEGQIDRTEVSMSDLIHVGGACGHHEMDFAKKQRERREAKERATTLSQLSSDAKSTVSEKVTEQPELKRKAPQVVKPKVRLDENGMVVVDKSSLFVQAEDSSPALVSDEIIEDFEEVEAVNSMSFKKRKLGRRSKNWTEEETDRFYEAITIVGNDFHAIASAFSRRSLAEVKRKFTREDKTNRGKISQLLLVHASGESNWDLSHLLEQDKKYYEDLEKIEEIKKQAKEQRKQARSGGKVQKTLNNNESTPKEIFAGPTNEEDLVDLIPDIMKHE